MRKRGDSGQTKIRTISGIAGRAAAASCNLQLSSEISKTARLAEDPLYLGSVESPSQEPTHSQENTKSNKQLPVHDKTASYVRGRSFSGQDGD